MSQIFDGGGEREREHRWSSLLCLFLLYFEQRLHCLLTVTPCSHGAESGEQISSWAKNRERFLRRHLPWWVKTFLFFMFYVFNLTLCSSPLSKFLPHKSVNSLFIMHGRLTSVFIWALNFFFFLSYARYTIRETTSVRQLLSCTHTAACFGEMTTTKQKSWCATCLS